MPELTGFSSDALVEELDRRLAEQGYDGETIGTVVSYLRDGWALVALPPDLVQQTAGTHASPTALMALSGELRRRILDAR